MRDLLNNVHLKRALSPVSVADNTPQVSQEIDLRGYNSVFFAILIGSVADADATFAVTMTESDTAGSGHTAVAADDLVGATASATALANAGFQFDDDNEVRKIGYRGAKRYVILTITPTGNASAALLAALAVLGCPAISPPINPPV